MKNKTYVCVYIYYFNTSSINKKTLLLKYRITRHRHALQIQKEQGKHFSLGIPRSNLFPV